LRIDRAGSGFYIARMPEITKLLTFDEFRAATGVEADALRQQRTFFQDPAAAKEVLGGGVAGMGWAVWPPDNAVAPVAR
jgi:hypothetical protein